MRRSEDESTLGGLEPVQVRMKGRGLPVPPLLPIVAAVALMVGISIGYGLAPKIQPVAAGPSTAAVPPSIAAEPSSPSPEPQSTGLTINVVPGSEGARQVYVYVSDGNGARLISGAPLPARGVSLAVAAANKGDPVAIGDVVGAKIEPYYMVNPVASPSLWVWAIDVRTTVDVATCGLPRVSSPSASPPPPAVDASAVPPSTEYLCLFSSKTVVVDYKTGIWLETISGNVP